MKIRTHLYKPARKTLISMETYFLSITCGSFQKLHRSSKVISLISLITFLQQENKMNHDFAKTA